MSNRKYELGNIPARSHAMVHQCNWNGMLVRLYSIKYFASFALVSPWTIRAWQRDGVIPEPVFKGTSMRLYTIPEIVGYTAIYQQHNRDTAQLKTKFHEFHTDFKEKMRRYDAKNPDNRLRMLLGTAAAERDMDNVVARGAHNVKRTKTTLEEVMGIMQQYEDIQTRKSENKPQSVNKAK